MRFLFGSFALFSLFVVGAASLAGASDRDGDGVVDSAEAADGTDADSADSDRDGAEDGVERALGTDALDPDSDNDGLFDGVELELGRDPKKA